VTSLAELEYAHRVALVALVEKRLERQRQLLDDKWRRDNCREAGGHVFENGICLVCGTYDAAAP
jgi:hypothetical protein